MTSDKIAAFIANRKWAWVLARYTLLPVLAAVHLVSKHIPEYIAEYRAEIATLDKSLVEFRTGQ